MTDKELGEMYNERVAVNKRLAQLNAAIGQGQRGKSIEDCQKIMCEYIEDEGALSRTLEALYKRRNREERIDDRRLVNGTTFLYGLYDKEELVYVGITNNLPHRQLAHERDEEKVFDDIRILRRHSDRFYALREENELIKEHMPKYNKQSFWSPI